MYIYIYIYIGLTRLRLTPVASAPPPSRVNPNTYLPTHTPEPPGPPTTPRWCIAHSAG